MLSDLLLRGHGPKLLEAEDDRVIDEPVDAQAIVDEVARLEHRVLVGVG